MTFTETQQDSSKLEKETVSLKKEIRSLDAEINKLENRVAEVHHQANANKARMNELREHRQNLLADEKDVKSVSNEIRNIFNQRELIEDELVGLEKRISALSDSKIEMERQLAQHERDIKISALYKQFDLYNDIASNLGIVVKEIYKQIRNDRELKQILLRHAGDMTGALENIPRLLIDTEGKTSLHTFEKHFFHASHFESWPDSFGE